MKKLLTVILILSLLLCFSGCSHKNTKKDVSDKKTIAVSIVPQATFVEKVCGDKFNIITMIPPGASAKTYEPTLKQMADFEDAAVYFAIGVPSEENNILPSLKQGTRLVSLHSEVEKVYPALTIDNERDPHLWLSPKRVSVMVNVIARTLSDIDPENSEFYNTNAKNYVNQLTQLDDQIKQILGDVKNRKFIAFHPSFGYFADDYSLSMYALEQDGKEADAKRFAEIADLAKAENIKVVFYQLEASSRQAAAFAEEIQGKAVCLKPLAADYIDNLKNMAQAIKEAMN